MRAYVACHPDLSRGIRRVADALVRHAPAGVEIVNDREAADLIVHHVVGVQNYYATPLPDLIEQDGKRYAVVQYCLRTTEWPLAAQWLRLWSGASVVWSYYDLARLCADEGYRPGFELYHSPLGVDAAVFKPYPVAKRWKIGTSGFIARTEAVTECNEAARSLMVGQVHLGPNLELPGDVMWRMDLTDDQVAKLWSGCEYVAGLRRCEGFELPAYEGLLCGSRPVMFDAPHYSRWMGDHAVYVPEYEGETLVECLLDVFSRKPQPVSEAERAAAVEKFDWARIIGGFWERAL